MASENLLNYDVINHFNFFRFIETLYGICFGILPAKAAFSALDTAVRDKSVSKIIEYLGYGLSNSTAPYKWYCTYRKQYSRFSSKF